MTTSSEGRTAAPDTDVVTAAAARLRGARESGRPCPPVRDLLGSTDVELAYRVQQANLATEFAIGRTVVGRKIGLTSPAVQQQLGVDQPDFGSLLDDMRVQGAVPAGRLLQPKVEAEIAFVLARDLTGDLETIQDVAAAVESAYAAIEIVDSRVAGWDITIVDTVADNASSGMFTVSPTAVPLTDVDLTGARMSLARNEVVESTGTAAACLGNPLNALLWLARTARSLGEPLRAGEVVLSGALGPMVAVVPGDRVHAEIDGLGPVEVRFDS
jgi:2-keto-4-pentenoate hydratase